MREGGSFTIVALWSLLDGAFIDTVLVHWYGERKLVILVVRVIVRSKIHVVNAKISLEGREVLMERMRIN